MKLIVTAGGQGTKIWPLSRESKPKQFEAVVGDTPLYERTIKTLLKSFSPEDIFISTKKRYFAIALKQSPQIPKENYILEPDIAKDRGPGEGLAFLTLSIRHPDEPFMIIQPDCLRLPEEAFLKTIKVAESIQKKHRKFISGGIKATYPVLGIDYLKLGNKVLTKNGVEIYETKQFIERNNNYQQTKELIQNFYVATHSNHNCWYPDLMLEAYKQHHPSWYEALMKIKEIIIKDPSSPKIDKIYEKMDKGPTELVTNNIFEQGYTILLPFKWTDIGTWDSVYEFFEPSNTVYSEGNVITVDTNDSLIKSENHKKIVATLGVENIVIVDTDDALLVCRKDRVGEIKDVLQKITKKKLSQYL